MSRTATVVDPIIGGGSAALQAPLTAPPKQLTGITDNTATNTYLVTVPNATVQCHIDLVAFAALGAGGAVGAGENSGVIRYSLEITRLSGAATVATFSTAFGTAYSPSSGGDTMTIALTASSLTGANSATQTFHINITVHDTAGSASNHTATVYATATNEQANVVTLT